MPKCRQSWGDKNQPVSQFALGFSIFICLFIQGLLFRKNLKKLKEKGPLEFLGTGQLNHPLKHTHITLKTGLTFSVFMGRFLCSRQSRAFIFLQVVKNISDFKNKRRLFYLARLLFRRLL
jgi:hypothetical protein